MSIWRCSVFQLVVSFMRFIRRLERIIRVACTLKEVLARCIYEDVFDLKIKIEYDIR